MKQPSTVVVGLENFRHLVRTASVYQPLLVVNFSLLSSFIRTFPSSLLPQIGTVAAASSLDHMSCLRHPDTGQSCLSPRHILSQTFLPQELTMQHSGLLPMIYQFDRSAHYPEHASSYRGCIVICFLVIRMSINCCLISFKIRLAFVHRWQRIMP